MNHQIANNAWKVAIIGAMLGTVIVMSEEWGLDECSTEPRDNTKTILGKYEFYYAVGALISYFLALMALESKKWGYILSVTVLWHGLADAIRNILSDLLSDFNCSSHANSVSGHACFFVFYIFTSFFLFWKFVKIPKNK